MVITAKSRRAVTTATIAALALIAAMIGSAPAHAASCSTSGGYLCITITLDNQNANFPGSGNTLYVTLIGTQDGLLIDSAGNTYPLGTSIPLTTASGSTSFTLQTLASNALASGRLYFSTADLTTIGQPPSNASFRYDYVEFTVNSDGTVNGDVTAIDQLGVPASMSFEDANGNVLTEAGSTSLATRTIGCWDDIAAVVESSPLVAGNQSFTSNFEIYDGSGTTSADRIRLAGPTWGPQGQAAWPSMQQYLTTFLANKQVRVRGYFAGNTKLNEAASPYDYVGTFDANGNLALGPNPTGTNDQATQTIYLPAEGFYTSMNGTTWFSGTVAQPSYGAGFGVYLQNGPYQLGGTAPSTFDANNSWNYESSGTFYNSIGNDIYGWIYGDLVASMANGFLSTTLGLDTQTWNTNANAFGQAFAQPQPAFNDLYSATNPVPSYAVWDLWQQAIATTSDSYGVSLGDRFDFQGSLGNPDMATGSAVSTIAVTLLPNDGCGASLVPATQTVTTYTNQPVKTLTSGLAPTAPNDMITFKPNGLTGTPTYTLLDATGLNPATLPAGLTFSGSTGAFTGAATASMAATVYTVSATDGTTTVTATVTLQVLGRKLTPTTQSLTGPIGKLLTSKAFTTTGFKKTPTFSAKGLPSWLTIDPATGIISGTPTVSQPKTTYLVTATDRRATSTANAQVTIAVTGGATLSPATQSVTLTVNAAMTPTPSLTAKGLVGTPTFTITPALPLSLSLNQVNGVISGTPATVQRPRTFTITGTDTSGSTATSTVTLTVNQAQTYALSPDQQTMMGSVGQQMNSLPMSASGFGQTVIYGLSAAPPPGMVFDSGTGILSGMPTQPMAATYLITGRGASHSAVASLTVHVLSTQPLLLMPLGQNVYGQVGTFTTSATVVAQGFTGPVTYALSSAPPPGLTFDPTTGTVSGIPTQSWGQTYLITASGGGQTGKTGLTFFIKASPTPPPPVVRSLSPNQQIISGQVGMPMSSAAMVPSGFANAVTYALSQQAPAGMTFNTTTGVLSGTPTQQWSQTYVITGSGATSQAQASLTVRISPAPAPGPSPSPTPTPSPTATPSPTPTPTPSCPAGMIVSYGPDGWMCMPFG